jgi:hypothetical protein
MALTEPWSFEVLGVAAGQGTVYCPAGPIGGVGSAPVRAYEAPRGDRAGLATGRDVHDAKTLTFPVVVLGEGGTRQARLEVAIGRAITLVGAWGAAVAAGETELQLRLPGFPGADDTLTYYGRPRPAICDLTPDAMGHIPALLEFRCLDPYGYRPAATHALATATNAGTASTDRAVITITGAGAPLITKTDTGETIGFSSSLPVGSTIDLRTGAVLDDLQNDVSDRLSPGPLWFDLQPGVNVLTISGATATIDIQDAYNI